MVSLREKPIQYTLGSVELFVLTILWLRDQILSIYAFSINKVEIDISFVIGNDLAPFLIVKLGNSQVGRDD